jgi:hypothetical protein
MLGRRTRGSIVTALILIGVLGGTAVAVASSFSAPILRSPHQGAHVAAGVVTLTVEDPGVPASVGPVYATISPKRTLDKNGYLKTARGCSGRCDFVKLHHWKGHPGMWIYKSTYNFPGYWAVTPGRYYWQANHVAELCQAKGCEVVSKIHAFFVG